ncbi:MAG TPA: triose-phosphate isomerase [Actinomycetota bacterium]|nr:triose-phosphate isomerase [Actinomycetota bacterium]
MRKPLIAGNWKMNKTHLDAMRLVQQLGYELADHDFERAEVVVCPPFTALRTIQTLIDSSRFSFGLGAQNMHSEIEGAYTGEVSPVMLRALDVGYVILGHSERRELFGESDDAVAAKVKVALAHELTPIVCCGETSDERDRGETEAKVDRQVRAAFGGLRGDRAASCVVAYEPIWAIGTGRTATPQDAQSTISYVRSVLKDQCGDDAAERIRILYGGSVKAGNAASLVGQPDVDGALVGGASLDAAEFASIVKAAQ